MPSVFISYAWEDAVHKRWVQKLAVRLRLDGIEVLLDEWELQLGDEISTFMERAIRVSTFVLVICTPKYKQRSDARVGGVGYEGSIMTAEVVSGAPRRKFIPILRGEAWQDSAPSWLLGSMYADLRHDDPKVYKKLARTLSGQVSVPPSASRFPTATRSARSPVQASSERAANLASDRVFVLVKMLRRRPSNQNVRAQAIRWLSENIQTNEAAFVIAALLDSGYVLEHFISTVKQWLRTNPTNRSWAHVWASLADRVPNDPEVQDLGKRYATGSLT